MACATDRKNPPNQSPELYRPALFSDITDPNVHGFYTETGAYWRKSGMAKTWKRNKYRACVPVKFGIYAHARIDENNFHDLFVRLDEVVSSEHANRMRTHLSKIRNKDERDEQGRSTHMASGTFLQRG